jgi:NADPH:quinone reductase-like Zn-dependent oxidoreductase
MTDGLERGTQMKAMTQAAFGSADVLRLSEVPKPSPRAGEVLVRVCAASPNPWDWHFMRGLPYISRLTGAGLRKPKNPILGSDAAGQASPSSNPATQYSASSDQVRSPNT